MRLWQIPRRLSWSCRRPGQSCSHSVMSHGLFQTQGLKPKTKVERNENKIGWIPGHCNARAAMRMRLEKAILLILSPWISSDILRCYPWSWPRDLGRAQVDSWVRVRVRGPWLIIYILGLYIPSLIHCFKHYVSYQQLIIIITFKWQGNRMVYILK